MRGAHEVTGRSSPSVSLIAPDEKYLNISSASKDRCGRTTDNQWSPLLPWPARLLFGSERRREPLRTAV